MARSARVARAALVLTAVAALLLLGAVLLNGTVSAFSRSSRASGLDERNARAGEATFLKGRQIFRYDTFGDQAFWGGQLQLHKAIEGSALGGVGPGVSPKTALSLGLKVDATAIPAKVAAAIKAGKVNLDDPKTTLALLRLNAVVGVKGFFNGRGTLSSVGLTCAVCHSTVDDSFAPGIGRRLDGWPNRDLNVGAIVASAPNLTPLTSLLRVDAATVKKVLMSWGPGKFDAELEFDGKAFRPDGKSAATLIPAAFAMGGVNLHTWEGWGSVTEWNALVANLELHGIGNFSDARLNDPKKFPVAARSGIWRVHHDKDLISAALGPLEVYQKALPAPKPPPDSYDHTAAARGEKLFDGKAKCATCHVEPTYTEPGWNMHKPSEICTDAFQANRGPEDAYQTTPLRGLFAKSKGGFYHDGRFATLLDVVNHYDSCFHLGLSARQKSDIVEYLKSL